ncbi:MAG: hypothetical protein GF317_22285 [Candidatus Lokiarchaeota archaeon]|nr:hypothetical protein [Candidatus Lokiarchaeota archaeon]MBD3202190.1 hypothetical protein [Candidatus Lokiarchaeota archaeon]
MSKITPSVKINEYIELKLEKGKTKVYIDSEEFIQCRILLTEIPINNIESLDQYMSIDELFDGVDIDMIEPFSELSSEEEFWGHSSNLQIWVENDYDTNLIHSNIAFPMLKKLTEAGDKRAKRVFKDEIAKRISHGYPPTIKFLFIEGYFDFLSEEELKTVLRDVEIIEFNHIGLEKFPSELLEMENLKELYLDRNEIKILPDEISTLKSLEVLSLFQNRLETLPETIGELSNLKKFNLHGNRLLLIPKSIKNLSNLRELNLSVNCLSEGIEPLFKIPNLESLDLGNNRIKSILPHSKIKTKSLKYLNLNSNELRDFPAFIGNYLNLEGLALSNNKIKKSSYDFRKLKNLKYLSICNNIFDEIPNSIGKLSNLKNLTVDPKQYEKMSKDLKQKFKEEKIQIKIIK